MARVGVADALLVEPADPLLDLVGGVAEDDDVADAGLADCVEHVLEDRPAVEASEGLRRPNRLAALAARTTAATLTGDPSRHRRCGRCRR